MNRPSFLSVQTRWVATSKTSGEIALRYAPKEPRYEAATTSASPGRFVDTSSIPSIALWA